MKRLTDVYGNTSVTLTLASICHAVHAQPDCTIAPILLKGVPGTGKTEMARLLASGTVCKAAAAGPCGACANCVAVQENRHPHVSHHRYAPDLSAEDFSRLRQWSGGLGGWHVMVFESVDRLDDSQVAGLSRLLDTRLPRTLIILTSHDFPDDALLSHAVALTTESLDEVQARNLATAVHGADREEPVPAELLRAAQGVPRAVIAAAALWAGGAAVSERTDYTAGMLRGALMGDMEAGQTAVEDHLKQGGTYEEAVTGWVTAVTEILTGRITGKIPAKWADLSDWLNNPRALVILRLVNEKGGLTFVHDPSTRLRALYALLCAAVDPSKFEAVPETKSVGQAAEPHVSPDVSVEELGAEFFGSD